MNLGGGFNRPRASETDPPLSLHWTTRPLTHDLDLIGPIELQLDAACTAPDTAFIAVLQDVDENENTTDITAGYLRAGLREVDEGASKGGAPCFHAETSKRCRLAKKSAIGYRSCPMLAACGLVIRFVCASLPMTKAPTAPHCLNSGTPALVLVPSTPSSLHRGYFCLCSVEKVSR